MLDRVKENAIANFMEMTDDSWTWLRMTKEEQESFKNEMDSVRAINAITGSYDQRWKVLQALYGMYLRGLGYGRCNDGWNWRDKESKIADDIEQFMYERGEYDYPENDRIPVWLADDRKITAWNIICDILNGNIEPLIEYLECEIDVMETGEIFDECAYSAKKILEKLKGE